MSISFMAFVVSLTFEWFCIETGYILETRLRKCVLVAETCFGGFYSRLMLHLVAVHSTITPP